MWLGIRLEMFSVVCWLERTCFPVQQLDYDDVGHNERNEREMVKQTETEGVPTGVVVNTAFLNI